MRYSQVAEGRPTAERGSHREIRHEQEGSDDGEQFAMGSRCGINTASVREASADDDVVDTNQKRERANCENDGQGSEACGRKSQTENVSFAGAPVTVEESCGAAPVEIAWAMSRNVFQSASLLY